jgi:hypothetical protein
MFPVWPVVEVEELIAALERDPEANDIEAYALTTAVAAAMIAQLQLEKNDGSNISVKASDMANECEKARDLLSYRRRININNVPTYFIFSPYFL